MKRPPRKAPARPKKAAGALDAEPVVVEPVDEVEAAEPSADPLILDAEIDEPVEHDDEADDRRSADASAEPDEATDADPKESSSDLSEDRYGSLVPADALQRYLAEIRRHPLLDPDEEHELAVRWVEDGDRDRDMGPAPAPGTSNNNTGGGEGPENFSLSTPAGKWGRKSPKERAPYDPHWKLDDKVATLSGFKYDPKDFAKWALKVRN